MTCRLVPRKPWRPLDTFRYVFSLTIKERFSTVEDQTRATSPVTYPTRVGELPKFLILLHKLYSIIFYNFIRSVFQDEIFSKGKNLLSDIDREEIVSR